MNVSDLDPEIYAHLRRLAARVHAERGGRYDSIQPTILLHEAWAKLAGGKQQRFENRAHFLATAARAMRFIMVDRARARGRLKRPAPQNKTTLAGVGVFTDPVDLLELEDALLALSTLDELATELVTLRVFGGLTIPEAAEALDISPRTADRRWRYARTWLADRLRASP